MMIDVELRIKDGEPTLIFPLDDNLSGDILEILFDEIKSKGIEVIFEKSEEGTKKDISVSLKSKKD